MQRKRKYLNKFKLIISKYDHWKKLSVAIANVDEHLKNSSRVLISNESAVQDNMHIPGRQ